LEKGAGGEPVVAPRLAGFGIRRAPTSAPKGLLAGRSIAGIGWAIPEGREGLFFVSVFQAGCRRVGLDAGILAKGVMRHFWNIANRACIACAGKIFCGGSGKIFGKIVFLEKSGEVDHVWREIFMNGIS